MSKITSLTLTVAEASAGINLTINGQAHPLPAPDGATADDRAANLVTAINALRTSAVRVAAANSGTIVRVVVLCDTVTLMLDTVERVADWNIDYVVPVDITARKAAELMTATLMGIVLQQ